MKDDYDDLNRKKAENHNHNLSDTIGVYCLRTRASDRTRASSPNPFSQSARSWAARDRDGAGERMAAYYLGVTSRIGLWSLRDRMNEALQQIKRGVSCA